jgi:hypothetical protein
MNVFRVKHNSNFKMNPIFNLYSIYIFFTVSYWILNTPNILISFKKKLIMHIIQGVSKFGCKQWILPIPTIGRKHQNRPVSHGKMPLPRK